MRIIIYTMFGSIISIGSAVFWGWCVQTNHLYLTGLGMAGLTIGLFLLFTGYEKEMCRIIEKLYNLIKEKEL